MAEAPVYKLADGVSFESVSDGSVVLVFRSGQLYSCNETSTAILTEIDGEKTVDEIATAISLQFDAAPETISSDVEMMTAEMLSEGIIVRVS